MNAFLKFPYQRKKPEWTEYGVELGADIFTEAEEKFGTQVTYVVVLTAIEVELAMSLVLVPVSQVKISEEISSDRVKCQCQSAD